MRNTLLIAFILHSSFVFSQKKEVGKSFIYTLLVEKNYPRAYSFLDEALKTKISQIQLEQTTQQIEIQIGRFKSIIEIHSVNQTHFYYSEFEKMKLDIKISFNETDKIIGFFFVPHKEFKRADSLGKELNIKSNNLELKGTLLEADNGKIQKLVIFVHGSGPQDRDATIFENKPFKDIAENLYSKGISSYRFDKRTLTNPESFNDTSTIDEEVIQDVLHIVDYFKNNARFKNYEIILLGHSLGAHLLPKIVSQTSEVSKILLLAGNSRPLDVLILQQYTYLYKLNPSKELKTELDNTKKQIKYMRSDSFNLKSPKEKLPMQLSAYYWKSLLEYNPLPLIKNVKIPILILQGERDYQVTMQDFNLWKSSLKNNKNAGFIKYPNLNHLFMLGSGPSTPQEYSIKGKVDDTVLSDIYAFIAEK